MCDATECRTQCVCECVTQPNVGIGEHFITFTTYQKASSPCVGTHLLFCSHSVCYDDFNILTYENKISLYN